MAVRIALQRRTGEGVRRWACADVGIVPASTGLGSRANAEHEDSREGKLGLGSHMVNLLAVVVVVFFLDQGEVIPAPRDVCDLRHTSGTF
jgi:hypothetical protein